MKNKIIFSCVFCVLCNIALAQEGFIYDPKGNRNPFIPLVNQGGRLMKLDKQEGEGDLSIEGIIYDKYGRSFAIVNGSVVSIGDAVGDYQVLRVEENRVIFIKEGQVVEVDLKKERE